MAFLMAFHQSSGRCSAPPSGKRSRGVASNSQSAISPWVEARTILGPDVPRSIARMYESVSRVIGSSCVVAVERWVCGQVRFGFALFGWVKGGAWVRAVVERRQFSATIPHLGARFGMGGACQGMG